MEIIVAIPNACQDLECWVKLLPLGFERTGSGKPGFMGNPRCERKESWLGGLGLDQISALHDIATRAVREMNRQLLGYTASVHEIH